MAQLRFDPSQYPVGSLPAGWTEYNASGRATIQDDPAFGRHLRVLSVNTADIKEVVLWTSASQLSAPLEMLALVEGEGSDVSFPGVLAFWNPESSNGYRIYLNDRSDLLRISRVNAASEAVLASTSFTVAQDVLYWIRVRIESGTIYAKAWQDGSAEPNAWMVSAADSTYTSGFVGFEIQRFGTNRYYWLGVGTDGDSAPSPGGAGESFSESIVLDSNQALSLQSQALALDSLSLFAQQLYGQIPKANAQTQSLLALIASILLEAGQGERDFSESILLNNSAALSAALRANLEAQIPLSYQTELVTSLRSLIVQTVELASTLDQTFDPRASVVATTILNLASGLLQVAQAMIAIGASLESITRVELVGSSLILELKLPSGRVLRIEADSRTFVIEPESRVIKIEP